MRRHFKLIPKTAILAAVVLTLAALDLGTAPRAAEREISVRLSRVPEPGIAPAVALGPDGAVHLVYGGDGKVFYARSADGGRTFSPALQVNTSSKPMAGGERGPKIALGRGGSLHVLWMAPRGQGLFYARAGRDGRFAEERNLLDDPRTDADGADIAADGRGRVWVVWLDPRLPKDPESPVSKSTFLTRSEDDGLTFSANAAAKSDYPGRACACCMLDATTDAAGQLVVGFRGGYQNIRDVFLLRGSRAARISDDGWKFEGCPMSGPFVQASDGAPLVAWMSQGQVYYAREGGPRIAPRAERPAGHSEGGHNQGRNYPLVLRNSRGEVLFAWVEAQRLRWESYSADGALAGSGQQEHARRSRPTGFVASDGAFTIVF